MFEIPAFAGMTEKLKIWIELKFILADFVLMGQNPFTLINCKNTMSVKLKYIVIFLLLTAMSMPADVYSKEKFSLPPVKLSLKDKPSKNIIFSTSRTPLSGDYSSLLKTSSLAKDKSYKVKTGRAIILGTVMAGVFTGMHIYYSNTWWKDKRAYFKFAQDGYYAREIDKASHVYTANLITESSAAAYKWIGFAPGKALLWGSITALAYETYIEIYDGFAPNWGFDWGDVGANIIGAVYPQLQRVAPALQDINIKWSFKPKWLKGKIQNTDDLLDDYTNMTFWLSVNPEIVLPKSLTQKKFYPNFLAIALGWSIKNASHKTGSANAESEWFLAFDIDIRKLPGKSDFMVKLKKILNFYHIPMPTVRFSPSGIWYGLYF